MNFISTVPCRGNALELKLKIPGVCFASHGRDIMHFILWSSPTIRRLTPCESHLVKPKNAPRPQLNYHPNHRPALPHTKVNAPRIGRTLHPTMIKTKCFTLSSEWIREAACGGRIPNNLQDAMWILCAKCLNRHYTVSRHAGKGSAHCKAWRLNSRHLKGPTFIAADGSTKLKSVLDDP